MANVSLVGFGRIGRDLFRQTLGDTDITLYLFLIPLIKLT